MENSSDGFPEEVEFFSSPVCSVDNEQVNEIPIHDTPVELERTVRRGAGRPRIIRTGARGRPKKLYRSTSVPNNRVRSVNAPESPAEDDRVQISDPDVPRDDTALNDSVTDEVYYDANVAEDEALMSEVNFEEAMAGPQSEQWKEELVQEIKATLQKNTWELVDRPKNRGVVGSRVVLTKKFGADGGLNRRKARLVAKGYSQKPGVDFMQTFAPVARLESLRLLIALAAKYKMAMHQLDIVTAYLNGHLDEEIFMERPVFLKEMLEEILKREGRGTEVGARADRMLQVLQKGDKVCLLKRALYGLKQAGQQWNRRLGGILRNLGLMPTQADPCLYFRREKKACIMALVYVDDILIASTNPSWTQTLKDGLMQEFEVKDLGRAKYCLGIEVDQISDGILLSQRRYTQNILERFGMSGANPAAAPGMTGSGFFRQRGIKDKEESKRPYRELIGALMYLAMATRPDIAFIVSFLGQFNNCHKEEHWGAAKRVLRYLRGTCDYVLSFRQTEGSIVGYSDVDGGATERSSVHASAPSTRRVRQVATAASPVSCENEAGAVVPLATATRPPLRARSRW